MKPTLLFYSLAPATIFSAEIVREEDTEYIYQQYLDNVLNKDSTTFSPDSEAIDGLELYNLFDGCNKSDLLNSVIRDHSNSEITCDENEKNCGLACSDTFVVMEYDSSNVVAKAPLYDFPATFTCQKVKSHKQVSANDAEWDEFYYWKYHELNDDSLFQKCSFETCPKGVKLTKLQKKHGYNEGRGLGKRNSYQLRFNKNKKMVDIHIKIKSSTVQKKFTDNRVAEVLPDFENLGFTFEIKFNQGLEGLFQSYDYDGLSTTKDGSSIYLHSFNNPLDRRAFLDQTGVYITLRLMTNKDENTIIPPDLKIKSMRVIPGEFSNLQCIYDENFSSAGVTENGSQVTYGAYHLALENDFDNLVPFGPFKSGSNNGGSCSSGEDNENNLDTPSNWDSIPAEFQTEELRLFLTGELAQIKTKFGENNDEYCLTDQVETAIVAYNPFELEKQSQFEVKWSVCQNLDVTDLNSLTASELGIASSQLFRYQQSGENYQIKSSSNNKCLTPMPITEGIHVNLNSCDNWEHLAGAGTFLFFSDCITDEPSQQFIYNANNKKLFSGCDHGLPLGKSGLADDSLEFRAFLTGDSQTLETGESVALDFGTVEQSESDPEEAEMKKYNKVMSLIFSEADPEN